MKTESAISMYNNLCTTEVGASEGEEISTVNKFGIFMLSQDCKLFLPYRIHVQKEKELPSQEDFTSDQIARVRDNNTKIRERNTEAKAGYHMVALALLKWANAIEELANANA